MKKNYKNKNWLKYHYIDKKMSMREIAKIAGVTDMTIMRNLKSNGIEVRAVGRRTILFNEEKNQAIGDIGDLGWLDTEVETTEIVVNNNKEEPEEISLDWEEKPVEDLWDDMFD